MNLQNIMTRVSALVGNDSYLTGALGTTAGNNVLNLINDSIILMRAKAPVTQDVVTFMTVNMQKEYNLPDDFVREKVVEYDGIPIQVMTFEQCEQMNADYDLLASPTPIYGLPEYYYIRSLTNSNETTTPGGDPSVVTQARNVLGFYPITGDEKQVSVYYSKRPPLLQNLTDIPAFPEEFHEMMVFYVMAILCERNKEFEQATYYHSKWEKALQRLNMYYRTLTVEYVQYVRDEA